MVHISKIQTTQTDVVSYLVHCVTRCTSQCITTSRTPFLLLQRLYLLAGGHLELHLGNRGSRVKTLRTCSRTLTSRQHAI